MVCHLRNGESMGPWGYGFDPSSSFDFYVLNAGNDRKTFRMVLTTLAKSVPILSAVECKRVTNMSLSRQKRGDFDLKAEQQTHDMGFTSLVIFGSHRETVNN